MPLHGIWNVQTMSIDGRERVPLITDSEGWRRVIFQGRSAAAFQRMDDTFVSYAAAINMADKSLRLTKWPDKNWKADFAFEQPDAETLTPDVPLTATRSAWICGCSIAIRFSS